MHFPGAGLWHYISFRTGMAFIASLIVSLVFGKKIIQFLQKKQVGEVIRNLGLEGQVQKQGTPTMGGLIIILAIIIPTFLFARIDNVYVWMILLCTVWLGIIGFIDDYIKVFKKNKEGLHGKFKILGQVGLGIIVGSVLFWHPDVTIRESVRADKLAVFRQAHPESVISETKTVDGKVTNYLVVHKSTKTSVPFLKNGELDYAVLLSAINPDWEKYGWIFFIPMVIFIITAVSNGANITDGLDGLAAGTSAIVIFVLGILAYVSGNLFFADYLKIMYIPNLGELVIFIGALAGACIGFLWYNYYPAQVFMGDTGSLLLGGLIAALSLIIRKELLIPVLCGVFLVENLSVIIQVGYFKYTKKKYGEGRRIFKMSPLHHHYQKSNFHESKIVGRFWIVQIFLAILTIITLKIR